MITGGNAQGKTNLLEAIGLLGMGRSFRTSHDRDIVRSGTRSAAVSGVAHVAAGDIRLACTIDIGGVSARKRYAVNGEPVKYMRYLGRVRVVTFAPADVALAAGPPSLRRSFLNAALAQDDVLYHEALAAYGKALEQKNALLRGLANWDESLLDVYDSQLAASGTAIVRARAAFAAELAPAGAGAYQAVAPGDAALAIAYRPSAQPDEMAGAIAQARPIERMRKRSLVGPHRDELDVTIGGRPIAVFGSQAQQRSAALALKLGELGVAAARSGESPLALFDDVLSELDANRQAALVRLLERQEQAFVTTAGLAPAGEHAVFFVQAATLRRIA